MAALPGDELAVLQSALAEAGELSPRGPQRMDADTDAGLYRLPC